MNTSKLYLGAEMAHHLGLKTKKELYDMLQKRGVLKQTGNRWGVTPKYAGMDLTRYMLKGGRGKWRLWWTERGYEFLKDLYSGQQRMDYRRGPLTPKGGIMTNAQ